MVPTLQRVKNSWNYRCWNNGPRLLGCFVWERYSRKIVVWKLLLSDKSIIQRTQYHPDSVGDYDENRDIHLLQFRTNLVVHYDLLLLKICAKCGMRNNHMTTDCKNSTRVCENCNKLGHSQNLCQNEKIEWAVLDKML